MVLDVVPRRLTFLGPFDAVVAVALSKIPFGDWNATVDAVTELYTLGGTCWVAADQVLPVFDCVRDGEVRRLYIIYTPAHTHTHTRRSGCPHKQTRNQEFQEDEIWGL